MALEDLFAQTVEEWKTHCYNKSFSSNTNDYLNCDAYRSIVLMGPLILPLIYQELKKEPPSSEYFTQEINKFKLKHFDTIDITLGNEEFDRLEQDPEYKQFSHNYDRDTTGTPDFLWSYVVKKIVPEFELSQGNKESDAAIKDMGCGFVGMDTQKMVQETILWLEQNMHQYVQK